MAKKRIKIERLVVALFITALIARVGSMYYAYLNFKTAESSAALGRHSRQVMDSVYHVQFDLAAIENSSNKFTFLHKPYYARLTSLHVANLNQCMQHILDSAKSSQAEVQTVNELGKMISDMEKSISPVLVNPPPRGDYSPINGNIGIPEDLIQAIIVKSNEVLKEESELLNTGRSSVVAKRRESLDETIYTSIIGVLFVMVILFYLNRDIGRRKLAEAKTKENEQKLRKMIEEVGDVIYSADYMGRFTFINARLTSLTGYNHDELIGKEYNILVHPEWARKVRLFYENQFKSRTNETRYEFPILTKTGKLKWVEQNVVLVTDDDTRVEGFQCVVRDITHRKDAEESMRAALEKEKQINELKSRFVSLASHEFRTPLSTILSSTELIREYMDHENQTPAFIKDKKIRHLNRIKSSIQNMVATLNNFLSLDQLELGKVSTSPESFDIQKFSDEIIDKIGQKLKPGQKIEYVHSSEKSLVFMDKTILGNVITNLLTNAIKYSPENSIVNYTTNATSSGLEFTVEDHGIGIPENEQVNLFERFFRAKNTLNIEGTGLGLSIVKKYVDLLDGHISFISHENEGSIFKIFVVNAKAPVDSEEATNAAKA